MIHAQQDQRASTIQNRVLARIPWLTRYRSWMFASRSQSEIKLAESRTPTPVYIPIVTTKALYNTPKKVFSNNSKEAVNVSRFDAPRCLQLRRLENCVSRVNCEAEKPLRSWNTAAFISEESYKLIFRDKGKRERSSFVL